MSDWSFHVYNQLTRDDHPQYAKTDGTRTFTGPLTVTGTITASKYVDSTDVLVGALAGYGVGPGSPTSYSASAAVFTLGVPLVNGHTYQVMLSINYGIQQTNAGSGTTQCWATDSSGFINSDNGNARGAIVASPAVGAFIMGSGSTLITATSTGTDTFTVHAQSPGTGSMSVAANRVELFVVRRS